MNPNARATSCQKFVTIGNYEHHVGFLRGLFLDPFSVKFCGITTLTNVAMQIVSLFRTNVNGWGLLLERRTHSVLRHRGSLPGPFEVIRHILSVALLRYVHTQRYEEPHAPPKPLSVELQTVATKETVNSREGTKPTAKGVRKKKKQR